MTHKIIFKPHNREIKVADGESLIRAAMETGVHINASCGGEEYVGNAESLLKKVVLKAEFQSIFLMKIKKKDTD